MYHYEHVNGAVFNRPDRVVELSGGPEIYFNSPYVKRWWRTVDLDEAHRIGLEFATGNNPSVGILILDMVRELRELRRRG